MTRSSSPTSGHRCSTGSRAHPAATATVATEIPINRTALLYRRYARRVMSVPGMPPSSQQPGHGGQPGYGGQPGGYGGQPGGYGGPPAAQPQDPAKTAAIMLAIACL